MTTEPINTDGNFPDPVTCPLHAKALEEIKLIVLDTRKEVIELKDMNGPIVALDKRVEVVALSVILAHEKILVIEKKQASDHDAITRWIGKAVGASGIAFLIIWVVLEYIFR